MTENTEKFVFEEALEQLDALVHQLEHGDLSIEQSLEAFEKGSTLVKQCQSKIDDAQMKVEKIIKNQQQN